MKLKGKDDKILIDEYKSLTLKALEVDDDNTFIEVLLKRDGVIKKMVKGNIELNEEEIEYLKTLEERVYERLEKTMKETLENIDNLSEKKRAIKKYTPKFPFPPMPAFFEKKG